MRKTMQRNHVLNFVSFIWNVTYIYIHLSPPTCFLEPNKYLFIEWILNGPKLGSSLSRILVGLSREAKGINSKDSFTHEISSEMESERWAFWGGKGIFTDTIGRGIEYLEMWDVFRPSNFTVALGSLRERERKVETGVSTKERNCVKCVGWGGFLTPGSLAWPEGKACGFLLSNERS